MAMLSIVLFVGLGIFAGSKLHELFFVVPPVE
jgi:hypothetical protein